MSNLKISIVTISYNEVKNIRKTLDSVLEQTYPDIEYIVIDGGSKDGTAEVIKENADKLAYWCSERDGGLFFGMNKGLFKCTGDYVLFCNAGDRLTRNDVIEKMVAKAEEDSLPDLVYGDCASEVNGELMVRTAHGPQFIKCGMPASHEAMLYKRSLIQNLDLQYDTTYHIAADYKFTYQFVNTAKSFAHVRIPVVVFSEGGVSTTQQWLGLRECCRVRHEVSGLYFGSRCFIFLMQCGVLALSTYARPIYRAIRLRRN